MIIVIVKVRLTGGTWVAWIDRNLEMQWDIGCDVEPVNTVHQCTPSATIIATGIVS